MKSSTIVGTPHEWIGNTQPIGSPGLRVKTKFCLWIWLAIEMSVSPVALAICDASQWEFPVPEK